MNVNEISGLKEEREGKTYWFCTDLCKHKFCEHHRKAELEK